MSEDLLYSLFRTKLFARNSENFFTEFHVICYNLPSRLILETPVLYFMTSFRLVIRVCVCKLNFLDCPEDRSSTFVRNVCLHNMPIYTANITLDGCLHQYHCEKVWRLNSIQILHDTCSVRFQLQGLLLTLHLAGFCP